MSTPVEAEDLYTPPTVYDEHTNKVLLDDTLRRLEESTQSLPQMQSVLQLLRHIEEKRKETTCVTQK